MKIRIFTMLAVMAAFSFGLAAHAADADKAKAKKTKEPDYASCTRPDIVGTWKLIFMQENPPIPASRDIYRKIPYQYLQFENNGTMKVIQSNMALAQDSQIMDRFKKTANNGFNFVLAKNGDITFLIQQNAYEHSKCFIFKKNKDNYVKGDVMLVTTQKKEQTMRIFRKVS
jgi:hypothetical protein